MSAPTRIGIPDGSAPSVPRNSRCPGAALVVDRAEYHTLQRDGLVWATGAKDIPHEGKTSARVHCSGEVETMKGHGSEFAYQTGLCAQCNAMERNQRRDLAERLASTRGGR